MQRVVFHIYHGLSHFNACFRMARLLRESFDVIFTGFEFFQRYVEGQGFSYYPLKTVPFGLGFEPWVNAALEKKKNIYWHSLLDRWSNRLYHLRDEELRQMMATLKPDYMLIDSWQSTDLIVLYPYLRSQNVKVAFVQTMLSTIVDKGFPPLNSAALPEKRQAIQQAHFQQKAWKLISTFIRKLKFIGKDNSALVRQAIRKSGIPPHYLLNRQSLFSLSFNHIDEFILMPKEFDFPGRPFLPHQHHLGFMIDTKRSETITAAFRKAEAVRSARPERPLIYCSFGSVAYEHTQPISRFLEKLIRVAAKNKYVLIIASPIKAVRDHFRSLPSNVFVTHVVPQLTVLSKASVFINHGGINSIKEAVYAGVPMLIYPVFKDTYQQVNGARVLYHGLGLTGELARDSETQIEEKIDELIGNPLYKERSSQLRRAEALYPDSKFLALFQKLKPLS
jgi:zeaxanthin glucosyltransferase